MNTSNGPCPSCGYCPCCGRGMTFQPMWPNTYPLNPWSQWTTVTNTQSNTPQVNGDQIVDGK